MISKISRIGLLVAISIYIFHFLFFWMYESTDSFFYFALAKFLKTGLYWTPHPYYYMVPSTMEPPLYSFFLFLTLFFNRADVIIHFIQLASILLSGFFIYRISNGFVKKDIAIIIALFFILTPSHLIYTSNIVAEPIAIFLITLYLYLIFIIYHEKKVRFFKYLFPLSAVMILQRYNLIIFLGFTFALFFIRKKKKLIDLVSLGICLAIITGWIMINHSWNGSWGLSNSEGKHLYNRVVLFDKLLPAENNKLYITLKEWTKGQVDFIRPWWYIEPYVYSHVGGSETKSSLFLQQFALAALGRNPIKYILNTPAFFLYAHGTNETFHDALYIWKENMSRGCRFLGTIETCNPVMKADFAFKVWDNMVKIADFFYLNISPWINYFLLLPSLIYAFLQTNKLIKAYAFLYLASVLLFVLVEAPLPRYLYIFTPLQILLISFMICRIFKNSCLRRQAFMRRQAKFNV